MATASSSPEPGRPTVRVATHDDIPAMAAIYAREAVEGHATFDVEGRPHAAWAAYVDSRVPGDVVLVAEDAAGTVLGYAYSTSYRAKPAYRHTRETTVYLAPAAQGRGVGRLLYADLLGRLRAAGVHSVVAGIALPNAASVRLHESFGFEPVGTFREVGHKLDRWIDVAFYELLLR